MVKVSIVLISYNVYPYIRECMESVVHQTLQEIEIICVDANSTDGTREILEEYADKDHRVRILEDDKGSCGYAYNKGIANAQGKYVGFVETDDYIELDMYATLYRLAEENELDFVKAEHTPFMNVTNTKRIFRDGKGFFGSAEALYHKVICPREYPEILWPDHCMWTGLYRKSFLLENKICLHESKGAAYQDHGFRWQTLCQAKRAMYIEKIGYRYRVDNENASMKSPKGLVNNLKEILSTGSFLMSFPGTTEQHRRIFYQELYMSMQSWCCKLLTHSDTLSAEAMDVLDEYIEELKKAVEAGHMSRIRMGHQQWAELLLLFQSKKDYVKHLKRFVSAVQAYHQEVVEKARKNGQTVIFGAGDFGRSLYWLFAQNGLQSVACFCDNDQSRWHSEFMGEYILSPEEAVKKYPDAFYMVANGEHYFAMERQLLSLGISSEKILLYAKSGKEIGW